MSNREDQTATFLSQAGWRDATRLPIAGDASSRRYDRLTRASGETAILMDAPDAVESTLAFVKVAAHLRSIGYSAPEIYSQNPQDGFLLLEDFGDDLFSSVIQADQTKEALLYQAAVDLLLDLRQTPLPPVRSFGSEEMAEAAAIVFDWYILDAHQDDLARMKSDFCEQMRAHLEESVTGQNVMMFRDYHVQNLIWLPNRKGIQQVGLLDFQDAMLCHPAYDLVSILQDARRDVPDELQEAMITHYIKQSGIAGAGFRAAYGVVGVQRQLRILGVFARLCLQDGKEGYVDLIPRVWGHLEYNLRRPEMSRLREFLLGHLPVPTPQQLAALKGKRACFPKR